MTRTPTPTVCANELTALPRILRRLGVVGTYVPRICGIATFTYDLVLSLHSASPEVLVDVIAMNSPDEALLYSAEVVSQVRQEHREDYLAAADVLNQQGLEAISLQHEFGIFGGADGELVLDFMDRAEAPIVTTLHTVLERPTSHQREVLCDVAMLSARLVVMSQTARRFLIDLYDVPADKIDVIPHGVHYQPLIDTESAKTQVGLAGRKTILTFGLLSGNKGIEGMLLALPAIALSHPDAIYIVLGASHPRAVSEQGESYVDGLKRMAIDIGMGSHTRFETRFVELQELCLYLAATDIYVTPYINEDQVTSGTLAYALGCGVATVSTPYWHAKELLAHGRGRLVPFHDPEALSREINELLANDGERETIRRKAYTYSRRASWQTVGKSYLDVFESLNFVRLPSGAESNPELDVSVA